MHHTFLCSTNLTRAVSTGSARRSGAGNIKRQTRTRHMNVGRDLNQRCAWRPCSLRGVGGGERSGGGAAVITNTIHHSLHTCVGGPEKGGRDRVVTGERELMTRT
jgi:hypothetical protein